MSCWMGFQQETTKIIYLNFQGLSKHFHNASSDRLEKTVVDNMDSWVVILLNGHMYNGWN